jgi:hypothetical protein
MSRISALKKDNLTFSLKFSEIKDHKEQVQCMFAVIEKLPRANYDLFERLTFHLAK